MDVCDLLRRRSRRRWLTARFPNPPARLNTPLLFAFTFSLALLPARLDAVPACPVPVEVTQPDGSRITLHLKGDEYCHWHEDAQGFAVVKSAATQTWVYSQETNGQLQETLHIVGKTDPAKAGVLKPNIARMKAAALVNSPLLPDKDSSPDERQSISPLVIKTGTLKNLVVLVNFSDVTIPYSNQAYTDLMNQIGYSDDGAVGSVKDYYQEVSYGALTVDSVVAGPVTLDNGFAYYGANTGGAASDVRPRQMVAEALAKLEASGFDFTTVDNDHDGNVDGLCVIHAGGGEEYGGNNPNYIWSHKWQMISTVTYDGVKLLGYHTEPARRGFDSYPETQGITRVGVICHETGHFLGLPDLYDTDYTSRGIGDFCVMAGGAWNGDLGNRPAQMSAWCKTNLGWVTPTVISATNTYSVPRVETNQQIYKVQGPFASNEYFLIENRQGYGFDASLPGSLRGLLIWHIDDNVGGNTNEAHYKVDLEEASGTQDLELNNNDGNDADYYRSGNATSFTSSTTPNNRSYAGVSPCLDITGISSTGSTMSFNLTSLAIPVAPTSAGVDRNNFCGDDPGNISLSVNGGSGATLRWFTGGCGGNQVGTGTPLVLASPTTTTTYYARWETACANSSCVSVTVSVISSPSTPSSVAATPSTLCVGQSATLSGVPGSGGDQVQWFTSSCGGTLVGIGDQVVTPAATTTYYARSRNSSTGCLSLTCVSFPVTVQPDVPADLDQDCDVDSGDLALFLNCLSGSDVPPPGGCTPEDLDADGDVDVSDFAKLQKCLSGTNIPPNPNCVN